MFTKNQKTYNYLNYFLNKQITSTHRHNIFVNIIKLYETKSYKRTPNQMEGRSKKNI
jgi:hypothetical protein